MAREQLSLPTTMGGFGLRSIQQVSHFSYFAALAQYYHRIVPLVLPSTNFSSSSNVPFIKSVRLCHRSILDSKIKLPPHTPSHLDNFFPDFSYNPAVAGYQGSLLKAFYKHRAQTLIATTPPSSPDKARLSSLLNSTSSYWLSTPPISSQYILPNPTFHVCCRLRLGLPPQDDLKSCSCGANLITHPLHFLTCNLLRSSITTRHDLIYQALARAARLSGIVVQSEPSLALGDEGTRSDGQFFFPSLAAHVTRAWYTQLHQPILNYVLVQPQKNGSRRKGLSISTLPSCKALNSIL